MKYFRQLIFILLLFFISCISPDKNADPNKEKPIGLTIDQSNALALLPLECIQKQYPNKPGQTLGSKSDIAEPSVLHPAFYGCFDWHSSVHGHWSLVRLLKIFPDLKEKDKALQRLKDNITAENIQAEVAYFKREHSEPYERTYGWAWLLKLAEELHTWNDPVANQLAQNLQPLTDLIIERYMEFLPKLVYPIRVGEHTNLAFGLVFAWDYANATGHDDLKMLIEDHARKFYLADINCPFDWEPSGYDFLSPCMEEIDIMRRVLDREEFLIWIEDFAPELKNKDYSLQPGKVSDRADGKLVHLDGLNFSRAWVLYGLSEQFAAYSHLRAIADNHIAYSLPNLVGDNYEGGHWLGSFAIYALTY